MHDSTTRAFFKTIKLCMEQQLDRNGWQWSANDSLFLDWAIQNIEADHAS